MKESEMREIHQQIRDTFEKVGIVDVFYVGVAVDGTHFASYRIGTGDFQYSNIERLQRMIGAVESLKFQVCIHSHSPTVVDDSIPPGEQPGEKL
jgi:hypothetical protein